MNKTVTTEAPTGSPSNPIPLPKSKKLLERYYAGKRLESPLGGHLDLLGIREGDDGKGRVLFECNTSSLRFVLVIPKATRVEKAEMKSVIEKGGDLFCPRHGPGTPLTKSRKKWVCHLCGISFGKS
jgi:ribosomal protein S27AE